MLLLCPLRSGTAEVCFGGSMLATCQGLLSVSVCIVQVAKGIPTAVTIASKDDEVAARIQDLLSTHRFRCYRTTDVQGAHRSEKIPSYSSKESQRELPCFPQAEASHQMCLLVMCISWNAVCKTRYNTTHPVCTSLCKTRFAFSVAAKQALTGNGM